MKNPFLVLSVFSAMLLTSCDTFWQGMASGMGGYGMYGNPYASPIGVLPYNLRPDVYAANALKQSAAAAQVQTQQMMESAERVKKQIVAEAEYRVKNGLPPVTVPESGTSSSSTSSTTSSSSTTSNASSRDCQLCLGTGKCRICNGTGWVHRIGIGHDGYCASCPNHSGRCSSCNGTGKR